MSDQPQDAGRDREPDPPTLIPPERTAASDAPEPEPLPEHLQNRLDRPRTTTTQARSQSRLIMLLMFGLIPMIVVLVVVLNSLGSGPPDPSARGANDSLNEVTRYCVYTARNDADYEDCLNRTDPRVIEREQTNAARYARGELLRCLSDATGYRCTLR